MNTINSTEDYSAALFHIGADESARHSQTDGQENKKSRVHDIKNSRVQSPQKVRQELKKSRNQEHKKSRVVVDAEGRTRRPVNLTIYDDVKTALDIKAAQLHVRVWKLMDQAFREYLGRNNEIQ